MRLLQTLFGFLWEGIYLVASWLSFRAIASGLLISAAMAVFMLMLGQPVEEKSDSEMASVVSQGGHDKGGDDVQVYLVQMDRGKEKIAFYLNRWKWIAAIIALVLGSVLIFIFLQQTDSAQKVSNRGVASIRGQAEILLAQMQRKGIGSDRRDRI